MNHYPNRSMEESHFTERATGQLVRIDTPRGRDISFIPERLPGKWEFDTRLWKLLADAKEMLGTLNGIGQTLENPRLLLQPLQSREAIASSNIEGTFVTPEQLLLFELDPSEPITESEKKADWYEVANYARALEEGVRLLDTLPLGNRLIRAMHAILMRGVRGRNKSPGEFRKLQVQIGTHGRFVPAPPNAVEDLMADLERYLNVVDERHDPLVRSFIVHYQFETIHPFSDGNGRVGRALLALAIRHWLGHAQPWLYMSAYYERNKDEYIDRMYRVSTRGEWSEWIEFCLRGSIAQAKDAIRRCHEFHRLKREFHDRVKRATPRSHKIIDGLFVRPVIQVGSIIEKYHVTYPTAKTDLDRLVESGILQVLEGVHPRAYGCPEVIAAAYSDDPTGTG